MSDNLLKRFSNASIAPNGNLRWRIETRSGAIDIECGKEEVTDIFSFLVQLAATAPPAAANDHAAQETFASFPLQKIGLQEGPAPQEMTLLIQTAAKINMGFRLPAGEFQRFAQDVSDMAQSRPTAGKH